MFIKFGNISGWKGVVYGSKRLVGYKLHRYLPSPRQMSEEDYSEHLSRMITSENKMHDSFIRARGTGVMEEDVYKDSKETGRDWLWGIVLIDTNELLQQLGYNIDDVLYGAYEVYIVVLVPENCEEEDIHETISSDILYFPSDKRLSDYFVFPELLDPSLEISNQSIEEAINSLYDFIYGDSVGVKKSVVLTKRSSPSEKITSEVLDDWERRVRNSRIEYISLDDVYMSQRFMGLYLKGEMKRDHEPWINSKVYSQEWKSSQYYNFLKEIGDEILRRIKIIRKHEIDKII